MKLLHCTNRFNSPIYGSSDRWTQRTGLSKAKETKMSFIRSFATWRRYRETCRELEKLTERELGDLGIDRSTIPLIARRAI